MFRHLQVRLYRFLHGEDVFDGWPGDERPRRAAEPQPAATRRPVRTAHHH